MSMNFLQLEYFVAVASEGNITKAAEKLYISQSALSQTIRKLEEEFSVCLFNRLPKKLVLTEAGSAFLEYAHKALSDREQITHQPRVKLKCFQREPRWTASRKNHYAVQSNSLSDRRAVFAVPQ